MIQIQLFASLRKADDPINAPHSAPVTCIHTSDENWAWYGSSILCLLDGAWFKINPNSPTQHPIARIFLAFGAVMPMGVLSLGQ